MVPEHVRVNLDACPLCHGVNDVVDGIVGQLAAVKVRHEPDAVLLVGNVIDGSLRLVRHRNEPLLVALAKDPHVVADLRVVVHRVIRQVRHFAGPEAVEQQADDGTVPPRLAGCHQSVYNIR